MILVAMVGALLAAPLLTRLALRLDLVDVPGSAPHKRHSSPTPMVGGPILALAIGIGYLVLRSQIDGAVLAILAASFLMLLWGLVDDAVGLKPLLKLLGQAAVTILLIWLGIQVRITQRLWLDLLITSLWVVGLINAFNFVDSMDGLAVGLGSIALAFFMLVTLDADQPELAFLSAAVFGGTLGLFFYNASPARIFLGDSGAQLLGVILAAIGIAYVPAGAGLPQGVTWFTPILVLGVPIFDASLVVISRLRRGRPIYEAQHDHTYHRLVGLGLSPTRSVLAMQSAAVLLGLIAFVALDLTVLTANLLFGGVLLIALGFAVYLETRLMVPRGAAVWSEKP